MPLPTYLDFMAFLDDQGLSCPTLSKSAYRAAIARANQAWEERTGWGKFLTTSADETRVLDGPQSRMIFPSFGIVSLTSLSILDVEYTVDQDYWLQYRFREGFGPYQAIELGFFATGARRSVELVGKFGFAASLTDDMKDSIMSFAAYVLYARITGIEGDIKREKQGPVEFEYQQPSGERAEYQGKKGELLYAFECGADLYKRATL